MASISIMQISNPFPSKCDVLRLNNLIRGYHYLGTIYAKLFPNQPSGFDKMCYYFPICNKCPLSTDQKYFSNLGRGSPKVHLYRITSQLAKLCLTRFIKRKLAPPLGSHVFQWIKLFEQFWPRGYITRLNSQTLHKVQYLAACGHVSASSQSLRFM